MPLHQKVPQKVEQDLFTNKFIVGLPASVTFCENPLQLRTAIWPEMITPRDAESSCFKGSRTSCTVMIFGVLGASSGRKKSHHMMEASCRLWYLFRFQEPRAFFHGDLCRVDGDAGRHQFGACLHDQLLILSRVAGCVCPQRARPCSKYYDVLVYYRRIHSLSVEISCEFFPGKQGVSDRSVLLLSYFLPPP